MIVIGSDHTGIELKNKIIEYLKLKKVEFFDATNIKNQENDDYPDRAKDICKKVLENNQNIGIAICGTGIGISISCNKIKNIRAALCNDVYVAEMSRRHNNANILCLGARTQFVKDLKQVYNIVDVFVNTKFDGGRHQRRIDKISAIENENKGNE